MTKIEISSKTSPFPKPIVLVGANVDGQANFLTVAWFNRMNMNPNIWGVALNKKRYTLEGIRENKTFSVNIPGMELVKKTDYCGIYSGRTVDKSKVFDIFYGKLGNAPMIRECPVTAECTVYDMIDLPDDILVLGEVQHVYTEERFLTGGVLDFRKTKFFVFVRPGDEYWMFSHSFADAYSVGKQLD